LGRFDTADSLLDFALRNGGQLNLLRASLADHFLRRESVRRDGLRISGRSYPLKHSWHDADETVWDRHFRVLARWSKRMAQ